MVYDPRDAKRNNTYNFFVSTEQTGNGAEQSIAHGFSKVPDIVLVVPSSFIITNASTFVQGVHTSTNVLATVTSGAKYYVIAAIKQISPRRSRYDGGVRIWVSSEQTGPQATIAHPLKYIPNKTFIVPSANAAGASTFTIASVTESNINTTGTTAATKYYVVAIANNIRLPRATKEEMFRLSTEVTGNASSQSIAHIHKTIPTITVPIPSYCSTAAATTYAAGTHTALNSLFTVTAAARYRVLTIF